MKLAYITFHVHNYGIGFTKNILGAFYSGKFNLGMKKSNYLKQNELENSFKNDKSDNKLEFDKVFYLYTSQGVINKITSTRKMKESDLLIRLKNDDDFKDNYELWKKLLIINDNTKANELLDELEEIRKDSKISSFINLYWKIIHYYNIEDQFNWFFNHSNSRKIYDEKNFIKINLQEKYQLDDLHDYKKIGIALQIFIQENRIIEEFDEIVINISSVGYEIQVVWFALAQAGWFPEKVKFVSTHDNKDQSIRFKDFIIKEIPKNILIDLSEKLKVIPEDSVSEKRLLAEKEFKQYFGKGFSILILGERGTGKTRLIQNNTQVKEEKFLQISAAAYEDDSKLESDLFGYVKGAFTDAKNDTEGLFHKVNPDGILFIDEIHSMSKRVQEKLMSSLSTDSEGNYKFKRVGGSKMEKVKFTIVFATNKSIEELKYKFLLPDFYDRVVQYTISIPNLREVREDIEKDWKFTWKHLKFKTECPWNSELEKWFKKINFPGNWRDLHRIAIWYDAFNSFDSKHKEFIGFNNPLDYIKNQYENICVRNENIEELSEFKFSKELTAYGQVENYMERLANWSKDEYGSFKKATIHFKELGDSITEKTLYNWANLNKN